MELSDEMTEEFREIFNYFDQNGAQQIMPADLGRIMRSFGQSPSDNDLIEMISEVDGDNKGYVTFEEFCELMLRKQQDTDPEENIKEAFKVFDTEQKGSIGFKDVKKWATETNEPLTDEQIHMMIESIDTDGDGLVSIDDFSRMMRSKNPKPMAEKTEGKSAENDDILWQ